MHGCFPHFDFDGARFTHSGERVTFEVLFDDQLLAEISSVLDSLHAYFSLESSAASPRQKD